MEYGTFTTEIEDVWIPRLILFGLKIFKKLSLRENGAVIKCYQYVSSSPFFFHQETLRQTQMEDPCNMSPKSKIPCEKIERKQN